MAQKQARVVDAEDQVLGRLCSEVAQMLLSGEAVEVVNAEKAIITGKQENVFEKYSQRRKRGDPHHGPYYPSLPEAILKRSIRGMLPYKKPRGREALERLRVHSGNPEDAEAETVTKDVSELTHKYVTLQQVSTHIRGGRD